MPVVPLSPNSNFFIPFDSMRFNWLSQLRWVSAMGYTFEGVSQVELRGRLFDCSAVRDEHFSTSWQCAIIENNVDSNDAKIKVYNVEATEKCAFGTSLYSPAVCLSSQAPYCLSCFKDALVLTLSIQMNRDEPSQPALF